jgi:hypothetical protein
MSIDAGLDSKTPSTAPGRTNQPCCFRSPGGIILIADSIRVNGRLIGIDKINHFIVKGCRIGERRGSLAATSRPSCGTNSVRLAASFAGTNTDSRAGRLRACSRIAILPPAIRGTGSERTFVDWPAEIAGRARCDIGPVRLAAAVHVRGVRERRMGRGRQLFGVSAWSRKAGGIRAGEANDDVSRGRCVFTVGSARRNSVRQSKTTGRRQEVTHLRALRFGGQTRPYLLGPL